MNHHFVFSHFKAKTKGIFDRNPLSSTFFKYLYKMCLVVTTMWKILRGI